MANRGSPRVSQQLQRAAFRWRAGDGETGLRRGAFGVVLAMLVTGFAPASGGEAVAAISPAAYDLLNQRAGAETSQFFVYQDGDSGFNHGFPSGFFGNAQQNISINAACVDDPNAPQGCSTSPNALDQVNGTVFQISSAPMASGQFAGIDFEEPQGYVASPRGGGYNLTGATSILFSVRSPSGITVQFGAGGQTTAPVALPPSNTYAAACLAIQGAAQTVCPAGAAIKLNLSGPIDLAAVHLLFTVVTNDQQAPRGGTVLLDNIRYNPVPSTQTTAPSLPLSTATFGVVTSEQGPFPPDQVNRNPASIYEASLAILALLPTDIATAQAIANGLVYALGHDNGGDPLPVAADGATGLHNAYESGDLALLNSQGAGAGQVRLAGFSASQAGCGASGYCLVQDGATGGNNTFAILALVATFNRTRNQAYLNAAVTIGNWIYEQMLDPNGTGFGGYFAGYPDEGMAKILETGKSTENNADIFAAFTALARVEGTLGNSTAAKSWTLRAKVAGDFVIAMFDASRGCFYAGTVPPGIGASPGIDPTGPHRGNDIVNRFDFLDSNSFTFLALSQSAQYGNVIPWPSVVSCLSRFATSVSAAGSTFTGYGLTQVPTTGPNGIAWEFTGQAAVVMEFSGNDAIPVLNRIQAAQATAPFGDRQGLVASTLASGDTLPPLGQCLNTPFQCIPERVGIAATAWAIFAETAYNPLAPSPLLAAVLPASRSVQVGKTATAFATIINSGATTTPGCAIAPADTLPLTFHHQTTNPATNQVTGTLDAPVAIAAGASQSFVVGPTATAAINPTNLPFSFACTNIASAPSYPGVNTLLFSASTAPVPDVVALAATVQNDGIVHVTGSPSQGAFAVATINLGASAAITAAANTGAAALPQLTINLCQTNPQSGQCISAIGGSVATTINANATPTFAIFGSAAGQVPVPFIPQTNHIFVEFADSGGAVRGETSVAVETQ